eukprot:m.443631 g.443631  ORF g.443631 m.443631 type:complete len:84 (+) comp56826_c0_seq20:469-720(+)
MPDVDLSTIQTVTFDDGFSVEVISSGTPALNTLFKRSIPFSPFLSLSLFLALSLSLFLSLRVGESDYPRVCLATWVPLRSMRR